MFDKDELDQAREMAARYMAKCDDLEDEIESLRYELDQAKTGSMSLGKEAEELRTAFEKLTEEQHFYDGDDAETVVDRLIVKINKILDNVDARDSLAYLESLEKEEG